MSDESACDVQQPVPQPFRFRAGELSFETEQSHPAEQLLRDQRELEPGLVVLKRVVREVSHAGVLAVADAVLDSGALAVAHLQPGDIDVGLVSVMKQVCR
jgi:hypothetical protein